MGPAIIVIDDLSSRMFKLLRTAAAVGEGQSVACSIKMAGSGSIDGEWTDCGP
jgi:hypothetical protein